MNTDDFDLRKTSRFRLTREDLPGHGENAEPMGEASIQEDSLPREGFTASEDAASEEGLPEAAPRSIPSDNAKDPLFEKRKTQVFQRPASMGIGTDSGETNPLGTPERDEGSQDGDLETRTTGQFRREDVFKK